MRWLWLNLLILPVLAGCYYDQIPDPNSYSRSSQLIDGRILQRNIRFAHADLQRRVDKGEISERTKDRLIRELVQSIAEHIEPDKVQNEQAYAFADVLRQAGQLEDAENLYRRAVEHAQSEDRLVNDALQLARVLAMQGKNDDAIKTARSTFDADPKEKAPILMAVLYEIVPAGLGKDHDIELAQLLIDSIDQQMQVVVNMETEGGQLFLTAGPSHVNNAWQLALRILRDANREDLMREAIKKREQMAAQYGTI